MIGSVWIVRSLIVQWIVSRRIVQGSIGLWMMHGLVEWSRRSIAIAVIQM
jgi:hypothetical protein